MKVRSYIILGIHKDSGKILGQIENSFAMGISSCRVRVYRSGQNGDNKELYQWLHKNTASLNWRLPNYEWRVYRVGSNKCPVKIDWRYITLLKQKKIQYDKRAWRNLYFSRKCS